MQLGLIHRPHPRLPRVGAALDGLAAPEACDWHRFIALDGDALGNDVHSNCVPCGALRSIQIRRAVAAGDARRPTAEAALELYRAWSGWDGSPASDTGTPSDTAAMRWARDGVRWGEQWEDVPSILGLDPTLPCQMRAAVALLGPVQLDLAMPLAWQSEASTWTVISGSWGQPLSRGAHRVCAGRYDPYGVYVVTWGAERLLTWPALARYGLNAEATLSRSWLDATGRSPDGLDLDALEKESRALAA
jgi:hypothetical protein